MKEKNERKTSKIKIEYQFYFYFLNGQLFIFSPPLSPPYIFSNQSPYAVQIRVRLRYNGSTIPPLHLVIGFT